MKNKTIGIISTIILAGILVFIAISYFESKKTKKTETLLADDAPTVDVPVEDVTDVK